MVRSEYPLTKNGKLWAAARDGELERVRELLAGLADPNGHASTATGSTALHEALLAGHREVVDALLKAGARVSVADSYGNTPLHACAASRAGDDPELTARLIAASGSDVRAKNSDGATALHLSALKGKPSMSRMLVDHGAPLHAVDRAGRDALSFAADAPTERVLLELIGKEVLDGDRRADERKWPSSTPWYLASAGKTADDEEDEPLKPPPRSLAPPPPPPPPDEYWGKGRRGKGARPGSAAARLHGDKGKHGVDATEAGSALGVQASMQERLVRAFLTADRDGTGSVSKRELYRALRAAGVKDLASDDALRLFQEADTDGDGQLSFEEFARVARKVRPLLTHPSSQNAPLDRGAAGAAAAAAGMSKQTRAKLRRAFVAFDADGSGNISLSELAAAFRQCGLFVPDAKLRRMFAEADVDNSGAIDLPEFEALARRLLLPSKSAKAPPGAEPPGAGSATAKVFAALERGGTGRIAAAELPHALKLLGIEADAPATERAVRDVVERSGGAVDEPSFTALVHLLLSGDAEAQYNEEASNAKKGGKKGGGYGYGGGAGRKGYGSAISAMAARAKEGEEKEAKAAARTEAEGVHARLAQAFALASSHDYGTVAAHEVGALLWRSGVIADAHMLAALRPAPSQAAKRIAFDAVLRLAAQAAEGKFLSAALLQQAQQAPPSAEMMGALLGKGTPAAEAAAAAAAAAGASDKRAMMLTVQRVVLSPWLAELQAVQSLFVIVRGELAPSAAMGGAAPLMLRSATQRKRGAQPLEVGLSAMLAGTAGLVEVELLHEPLASGAAHLLGSAQLELGRLYTTTAPPPASSKGSAAASASASAAASKGVEQPPLEYELPLYDARATHAATIHLSAQPHAALTPPTQPGDAAAAAAPSAAATTADAAGSAAHLAQVHTLEAQLEAMRARADALAKENARLAKSQPRSGIVGAGGISATSEMGPRYEPSDWRRSEVDALQASLARLKRNGDKAAVVRTVLESTRDEMEAMVEQEQKERAAAAAAREAAAFGGFGIPTV